MKKKIIIIISIVIILISAIIIFLITNKKEEEIIIEPVIEKQEEQYTDIPLYDKNLLYLYQYIKINDNKNLLYKDNIVEYKTLSDEEKNNMVFYYMNNKKLLNITTRYECVYLNNWDTFKDKTCTINDDSYTFDTKYQFYDINKITLNKYYQIIFGENINPVSFEPQENIKCEYNNIVDNYICYLLPIDNKINEYHLSTIEKAYQYDERIEIYDRYLYCKDNTCNTINDTILPYSEDITDEEIITNGKQYKHIFKKDDTGVYHWVSTEPIEEE